MERFIKSIILILVVVFIGYFIINISNNSLNSNNDDEVAPSSEYVTIEDFNALKEEINSSNNNTASSFEIKEFNISGTPIVILDQYAGIEITDSDLISSIEDFKYEKNFFYINCDAGYDLTYSSILVNCYYYLMGMDIIGTINDFNMMGILKYNNNYYFVNDDFINKSESSSESGVVLISELAVVNFKFVYFN